MRNATWLRPPEDDFTSDNTVVGHQVRLHTYGNSQRGLNSRWPDVGRGYFQNCMGSLSLHLTGIIADMFSLRRNQCGNGKGNNSPDSFAVKF